MIFSEFNEDLLSTWMPLQDVWVRMIKSWGHIKS